MFFWMVPFISNWIIGNDYTRFPIQNQLELMFSLKTGSVPLYIPGFAGGQSASALTLGQMYHPISHLAALMPGYWHGKALEWNTLLRLISLGIAHLFLYKFLCRIRLNIVFAFLISTVTVYNLRMLDLFRYGASLESWTGLIFRKTAQPVINYRLDLLVDLQRTPSNGVLWICGCRDLYPDVSLFNFRIKS